MGLWLRHRLEYFVFRSLACLLQMLDVRQTAGLARGLAWVFCRLLPRKWTRYHVAHQNITESFPEKSDDEIDAMIYGMWVHLFRMVAEMCQLPRKVTLDNCRDVIVFRNRKASVRALCSGRPVMVLGGHFGNWEVSMATFGMFGFRMGVVARPLDNPLLNDWFTKTRKATGHALIWKRGGVEGMVELMQQRGGVGLLGDQDAGRRGLFVDFFGRPASTFKSLALMAMEFDALIVVGYGIRLPDDPEARWARYEIGCEDVIDPREIVADNEVEEITRRYTRALERAIRRAPEQYFWVHRRWKTAQPVKRQRTGRAARVA